MSRLFSLSKTSICNIILMRSIFVRVWGRDKILTRHDQIPHWQFLFQSLPTFRGVNSVLDFGCGDGALSEAILRSEKEINVTAIEIELDLVEATRRRLGQFESDSNSVQLIDGFSLDASDYDLIFFNPPMVPNEKGFFGHDQEWVLLQYLEWVKNSNAQTALMLFDYCASFRTRHGIKHLDQAIAACGLSRLEVAREPRIVHDNSPVWRHRNKILSIFPALAFKETELDDLALEHRTVDRIVHILTRDLNR